MNFTNYYFITSYHLKYLSFYLYHQDRLKNTTLLCFFSIRLFNLCLIMSVLQKTLFTGTLHVNPSCLSKITTTPKISTLSFNKSIILFTEPTR